MDLKKLVRHRSSRGRTRKGDTAQLAAQLAPLEEQDQSIAAQQQVGSGPGSGNGQVDRDYGAIVVDKDNLNFPKDMMEGEDEKRFLGVEPVVLVILGVMLIFIAFIAWQISLMPAK